MPSPERRPALTKAPTNDHPLSPAGPVQATAPRPTPEQPPGAVMLSARVPPEVRDELKMHAVRSRQSIQEVVLAALRDYLSRNAL